MAVRSEHLKRLLLILSVLSVGVVALLYWGRLDELQRTKPRSWKWSTWTWDCVNGHCVRRVRGAGEKSIPLATCRMLCGALPLWPLPLQVSGVKRRSVPFSRIRIEINSKHKTIIELLQETAELFKDKILAMVPEHEDITSKWHGELVVVLKVAREDQLLSLHTDESYTLNLTQHRAQVQARTFFGARHALETLTQLVWWNEEALRVLEQAYIRDSPRFSYRGVMVDTSRNFIPLPALKRTVDALSASKLNVFHWHITDSQSFPFDSPRVPEMARYGAYSSEKVYSASDVAELVKYGRVRGVRVIMEIDVPAHAGNGWQWGPSRGLGNLSLCINRKPWNAYCGEPPCGQLNPDNFHTFEVLGKLYEDIIELTNVTDLFHAGGDEVDFSCWTSELVNASNLMKKWYYFEKNCLGKLAAANKGRLPEGVVLWHSKYTTPENLDRNIHVVQTWGVEDWGEATALVKKKYRVIISHLDYWYLDCGFGNWRGPGPGSCNPVSSWQKVYQYRPWLNLDRALVLGGEVCLWGEMMDEYNLDMKLWPRAAAFAERVWSDPETDKTLREAHGRLIVHRERLVGRGIRADAMWPEWCTQNPYECLEPLDEEDK